MNEIRAIKLSKLRGQIDQLEQEIDEFKNVLNQEGIVVIEDWKLSHKTQDFPLSGVNLVAVVLEDFVETETDPDKRRNKMALIFDEKELVRFAQTILKTFDPPKLKTNELVLEELQHLRGIIESQ